MDFDPNNALKSTLHGPLVSDFRPSLVTNFSNLYYVRKEIFRTHMNTLDELDEVTFTWASWSS
ncbi:hypothetical protein YC2023_082362 [Brassica napus]